MRRLALFVGLLAAVGIGGAAYYRFFSTPATPEIVTAPVTRGDVIETVGATGTLEAVTTVQVGTQVSGTISELHADFNAVVRKGQVVARLDPSLFETQIEQARANLLRAEADGERLRVAVDDGQSRLRRAEELSARSLIPQQELESAQLSLRTAEAQLRSAHAAVSQARATLNQNEVNLRHTVIEAPIDGIVISRNVDVGQTVAASMQAPTLFVIAADLTKMRVNANVDEADVGKIRPGQRVGFRVDAYPSEEFVGTVSQVRLQPQVVQNVVTYNTVIEVPNPDFKLKPGMTANVGIEIARREGVPRVPNAALRFRPTAEIFAALGQPAPGVESREQPGGRFGGAGGTGDQQASAGRREGVPERSEPAPRRPSDSSDVRPADAGHGVTSGAGSSTGAPGSGGSGTGISAGRHAAPAASSSDSGEDSGLRRQRRVDRLRTPSADELALRRARDRASRSAPATPGAPSALHNETPVPADTGEPRPQAPSRWRQAQTVDVLFGPLPREESTGRAWTLVNGRLEMLRLRLGISDGTFTEVIGDVPAPGTLLVTSVALPVEASRTAGAGQSPLLGPPGGRGPPGVRNVSPGSRR